MKKWFLIAFLLGMPYLVLSQDKKIDQLEVLYSQKFYSKVLKKANKLLAIPDYDYSGMPSFYKSLALFRLLEDEDWSNRHKNSLTEAIQVYDHFLSYAKVRSYTKSHYFEILELKQYLTKLERKYATGNSIDAKKIRHFINNQLKEIVPHVIHSIPPQKVDTKKEQNLGSDIGRNKTNHIISNNDLREEIVQFAKQYIGTPYSWAGTSPAGFDCSGYIGYVFKNYDIILPRSASEQKEFTTKINERTALKGDLVFFKSGSKITHVGLVVSEQGQPLTMIHSSSSKGIIITDVESSAYWNKKYAGLGRIIQ